MKTLKHLFTALLLLCSSVAFAHAFEVDGIYYSITNSTTKKVKVTYSGSSYSAVANEYTGSVVIPESVTYNDVTYSVTSIGSEAFSGCSGLTSVAIPSSVTSIENNAFHGCSKLKEVHISDLAAWCSIDFGNSNANPMYHANNLYLNGELVVDELIIPEGVTEIKNYAFYNYNKLVNVTIPSSVTSIGNYAFCYINAVFNIAAETLPTVGSSTFHADAVIVVPDASVDAYKAAWSNYANQIVAKELAVRSVEIDASGVGSALRSAIGDEFTTSVADLTVKGTINSYDVIVLRTKMPLLHKLDLSQANIVASDFPYYNNHCTSDNEIGDYMFYGCSSLRELKIPENITYIGERALSGCSSLVSFEMPDALQTIESAAFTGCSSLKSIVIPNGVKTLPDNGLKNVSSVAFGLFYGCSALESVTLPDGLENISRSAFHSCKKLKEIMLPPTVKIIEENAFEGCSSLEVIRIPSSLQNIENGAFNECNNVNKVYTYTVEPLAITEGLFPSAANATLYLPSQSRENYYFAAGWNSFLKFEFFDEPYEYFYVNNDYTLNDDTGYIEGTEGENPDADINAGGGFIVEGEQGDEETPNQSLGDVNVGSNGEGTSGSIIGDNNLHIDDLHIRINVKGGRWYFFAFPFDIFFKDITMENGSDYVFRYYDGAERAQNGKGGWKDINENHLKAARGYIFQCSANDVLVLNIKDVKFKKEDKYNELVAHVSNNLKDASWNFTGNPYLSYYDMADMDYTAPVTVWDGSKYVAIRPGDDDYHFAPYEAFFVQKPEGQDEITFEGEEQMTKNQSNKKKEKQAAARRARSIDPERLLINLVLGNGTSDDRTRIVFNERQSLGYETSCDATKFETAGVAQLYTIGSDKVHYAINERPADNGRVVLGYTAPTAGFYTIEAQRMDAEVYVKDFKTGTLHNLKDGAYSFGTDAGTFNDRFEILLKGTAPGTTGIDEVEGENGEVKTEIYDLQGRKMQDAGKGIYIINGEKVVK